MRRGYRLEYDMQRKIFANCRCLAVVGLALLVFGLRLSAQTTTVSETIERADLKLVFSFPLQWHPRLQPAAKDSLVVSYAASKSNQGQVGLSFVPRQQVVDVSAAPWPTLERMVIDHRKRQQGQLVESQATWVSRFPAYRYTLDFVDPKTKAPLRLFGQFVLCPDAVIVQQRLSPRENAKNNSAEMSFFQSLRRPGLPAPTNYALKFADLSLRYPPGFLPRERKGIMTLCHADGRSGIILQQDNGQNKTDGDEDLKDMAALVYERTRTGIPVTVLKGPGFIAEPRGLPKNMGLLFRTGNPSAGCRYQLSRFLRFGQKRLFVAAYRMAPAAEKAVSQAHGVLGSTISSIITSIAASPQSK